MRILVLCDRYPFPLSNGQNLRIFHYVNQLRQRHTFDLLCYGDAQQIPGEIRPLFEHIAADPRPQPIAYQGWKKILHAFDLNEFVANSTVTRQRIEQWLAMRHYDLIWVSGWDMIVNLPTHCNVPVLADAVDDGVLEYWRECCNASRSLEKLRLLKLVWMNIRFERKHFAPQAGVLFVSERDAAVHQRIAPRARVHVVHNGVDTDYFAPNPNLPKRPNVLIFEGNMSFGPNRDGMAYFCAEILPLIRAEIPDVELQMVGRDPPQALQQLATQPIGQVGQPGIAVTGFVDDVRPYLAQATVFICPLRKGAGIKNKLLQAWSIGLPIVATPLTLGGLHTQEGENVISAEGAQAFADAVIKLLRDPAQQQRLSQGARATALAHYSWQQKSLELETVMQTCIAR